MHLAVSPLGLCVNHAPATKSVRVKMVMIANTSVKNASVKQIRTVRICRVVRPNVTTTVVVPKRLVAPTLTVPPRLTRSAKTVSVLRTATTNVSIFSLAHVALRDVIHVEMVPSVLHV